MVLITGEKFFGLADYICHGLVLETVKNSPMICKPYKVMAVEGHNFQHAIQHIRKMQHETFVLISHNSDANIIDHPGRDFDYHYVESEIPGNIKRIFSQNLNVLSERIRPLPIDLENTHWHKGDKFKEIESMIPQEFKRDKWLYVNHAIATNPIEREEPYRLFKGKDWATCSGKKSFLEYLTDMKRHKFKICGFGNGLDSHSVWEALYMSCVPIMKRAVFTEMFSRILPIIIVDKWEDVTLDNMKKWYYTEKQWEEWTARADKYIHNNKYDALDFTFWEKVIKGEIEIS